MNGTKYQNRSFYLMPPGFAAPLILCLLLSLGYACSEESASMITFDGEVYELILDERSGTAPQVPNIVPHQQLDQNSPSEILESLKSYLFSLEHVEERRSQNSLPSALGAYIKSNVKMNSQINREFTHIHMEPGPGSQHLALTENDFQIVIENGWGVKHPWSDSLTEDGLVLVMVYAPRNEHDLENVKKIISAAWHLALSVDG